MDMNQHLRRAIDALELGAADIGDLSRRSSEQVRQRLRRTVEEVLDHLEAEEAESPDVMTRLDRQSRDIAEDLRRAERLMKQRPQQD